MHQLEHLNTLHTVFSPGVCVGTCHTYTHLHLSRRTGGDTFVSGHRSPPPRGVQLAYAHPGKL